MTANPDVRNRAMTAALRAAGVLTDARVEAAMHAVPRHLFAPDTGWLAPDNGAGPGRAINRHTDPDGWWDAVYSDGSIITQREDGAAPADAPTGTPTSSLSGPGAVAGFLQLLDVRARDRVLEIGTGTGWTAALLTRLGADVTTIEVDPNVADQATANLKAADVAVHLVIGDGARGRPDGGPYDRVHATCAVTAVPYPWVEQTRPGGVIVAPWQPMPGHGWKLRLTVSGPRAVGRFHGAAGYMLLRAHRTVARWNPHHADDAGTARTRLDPRTIHQAGAGFMLAIAARCPRLGMMPMHNDDGSFSLLLFEPGDADGSWATCDWEPGHTDYQVTQYGARRLWDETAAAFAWWVDQGAPGPDRYGLTVTEHGEHLWLDHPATTISPAPP
ncbi:protein-L-isoaspartate O-methyltransferase [Actinomadura sp. NBRC 104425]|uniref:methyltransferase domain-containing protein n=1 Tax=Actinomadura sp. NBRC 104425 TaxID=3032204 RepID=UPI0024A07B4C|nr:methyltransferase domain-containing protein [Actinomadura sp. NBRC 104425]GLZ16126.1 protein-L-isoaspartate O-methyltransferase [Actinomadura sp. NBRC 104425]